MALKPGDSNFQHRPTRREFTRLLAFSLAGLAFGCSRKKEEPLPRIAEPRSLSSEETLRNAILERLAGNRYADIAKDLATNGKILEWYKKDPAAALSAIGKLCEADWAFQDIEGSKMGSPAIPQASSREDAGAIQYSYFRWWVEDLRTEKAGIDLSMLRSNPINLICPEGGVLSEKFISDPDGYIRDMNHLYRVMKDYSILACFALECDFGMQKMIIAQNPLFHKFLSNIEKDPNNGAFLSFFEIYYHQLDREGSYDLYSKMRYINMLTKPGKKFRPSSISNSHYKVSALRNRRVGEFFLENPMAVVNTFAYIESQLGAKATEAFIAIGSGRAEQYAANPWKVSRELVKEIKDKPI
jgi:hypothetical protein